MEKRLSVKSLTWLFALIYFASYVTRINFSAIVQEIVTATGYEKSLLSTVLVCLSVTYGVGQIINGWIGDRVKPQNLILCGLIIATIINILLPFFVFSIPVMCALWAINGFAQAMMWPPIVKILVGCANEEEYGYAVVRISWGSSIGTIFVYLCSPFIIKFFTWEVVFAVSAVIGLVATIVWASLKKYTFVTLPKDEKGETLVPAPAKFPKEAVFPIVFIVLAIIFQGMLRDGITSWMPTYLSEVFGLGNSESILSTVVMAVFSMISFSIAGWLYKRFFKNEVACGVVMFAVVIVFAVALFLLFDFGAVIALLFATIIIGAIHGVNLMLITHVPKRFRRYGNISTISGLINSCTYIGAATFTYGAAAIAENSGWQATVGVWVIIAILGTASCLIAMKPWKKFMEMKEE